MSEGSFSPFERFANFILKFRVDAAVQDNFPDRIARHVQDISFYAVCGRSFSQKIVQKKDPAILLFVSPLMSVCEGNTFALRNGKRIRSKWIEPYAMFAVFYEPGPLREAAADIIDVHTKNLASMMAPYRGILLTPLTATAGANWPHSLWHRILQMGLVESIGYPGAP
jgi:hypothetical protein